MPLDPRVRRFLDALAAGNPPAQIRATVEERRKGLRDLMQLGSQETPVAAVEDLTLPGPAGPLDARIYTPLGGGNASRLPGLVYFHGGGFVAGSIETHDAIARALANAGHCRVVSVGYRLAPESPFPAALEDARAAVRYIAANAAEFGIDGAHLGVAGDSAGGTLAAATCEALAHDGGPQLAVLLLLCPILDYRRSSPSRREYARGYLVDQDTLDHDLRYYLPPGVDPGDPRVSPLRAAELTGLPPTLIHTAEFDPLCDDGRDYGERLAQSGVPVSYTCHAGMIHLFYGLGGVIPYARTAYGQLSGEIKSALSRGTSNPA